MFGFLAPKLKNLLFLSKIHKIINAKHHSVRESHQIIGDEFEISDQKMMDFCKLRGIKSKYLEGSWLHTRKFLQHSSYKVVGNFGQKILYQMYLLYFTWRPRRRSLMSRFLNKFKKKFKSINSTYSGA